MREDYCKVTEEVICKVHESMSDEKVLTEIVRSLKETEPIFMDEVVQFAKDCVNGLEEGVSGASSEEDLWLSITGAIIMSCIMGFLICKEKAHGSDKGGEEPKRDLEDMSKEPNTCKPIVCKYTNHGGEEMQDKKKYQVNFSELIHYNTVEVEAEDADSALEIFFDALDEGRVEIRDVETAHHDVKEIQ